MFQELRGVGYEEGGGDEGGREEDLGEAVAGELLKEDEVEASEDEVGGFVGPEVGAALFEIVGVGIV